MPGMAPGTEWAAYYDELAAAFDATERDCAARLAKSFLRALADDVWTVADEEGRLHLAVLYRAAGEVMAELVQIGEPHFAGKVATFLGAVIFDRPKIENDRSVGLGHLAGREVRVIGVSERGVQIGQPALGGCGSNLSAESSVLFSSDLLPSDT